MFVLEKCWYWRDFCTRNTQVFELSKYRLYLPTHIFPLLTSLYPVWQIQSKLPAVFTQVPSISQRLGSSSHSSISEKKHFFITFLFNIFFWYHLWERRNDRLTNTLISRRAYSKPSCTFTFWSTNSVCTRPVRTITINFLAFIHVLEKDEEKLIYGAKFEIVKR